MDSTGRNYQNGLNHSSGREGGPALKMRMASFGTRHFIQLGQKSRWAKHAAKREIRQK